MLLVDLVTLVEADHRTESTKTVPLTCHGHSRPVTHLSFSDVVDDNSYYLLSSCKGLSYPQATTWTNF